MALKKQQYSDEEIAIFDEAMIYKRGALAYSVKRVLQLKNMGCGISRWSTYACELLILAQSVALTAK